MMILCLDVSSRAGYEEEEKERYISLCAPAARQQYYEHTHLSMFHIGASRLCESSWNVCVCVCVFEHMCMHVCDHVIPYSYG